MNNLNICFVCLLLCCCTNAHKHVYNNEVTVNDSVIPVITADSCAIMDTTKTYHSENLYVSIFNKCSPHEVFVSTSDYYLTFGLYDTNDSNEIVIPTYDGCPSFIGNIAKINILNESRNDTLKSVIITRSMLKKYLPWLENDIREFQLTYIGLFNNDSTTLNNMAFEISICKPDSDFDINFLYYPFRPEEEAFEQYDKYVSEEYDYDRDTTNVVENVDNMEFVEIVENTDTVGVVEDERD